MVLLPGYAYCFDYLILNIRASSPGVPHTYEIPYVFGSLSFMPQAPKQPLKGVNQCARIGKDVAEFNKHMRGLKISFRS